MDFTIINRRVILFERSSVETVFSDSRSAEKLVFGFPQRKTDGVRVVRLSPVKVKQTVRAVQPFSVCSACNARGPYLCLRFLRFSRGRSITPTEPHVYEWMNGPPPPYAHRTLLFSLISPSLQFSSE